MKTKLFLLGLVLAFSIAQAQEDQSTREVRRAAFEECVQDLGIEAPQKGQAPPDRSNATEEEKAAHEQRRASLDACMKEKGFDPPTHQGKGPRPQRAAAAESGTR